MRSLACALVLTCSVAACSTTADPSPATAPPESTTTASAPAATPTTAAPSTETTRTETTTTSAPRTGSAPPDWLGTRVLPLQPGEDIGVIPPTPAELVDRRFWTVDTIAPPADDVFVSEIVTPPPAEVVARSTWAPECPVALDDLAYAQVSFVGFDGLFHTGELLTHVDHVAGLVDVFAGLHAMRFPIEEMTVTTREALDAPPTGDGNNTSGFVCRPVVGSTSWSRHAMGGAVDLNPFQNPYVKGELVIPELASAYVERDEIRPGMTTPAVARLFADIGWSWGGTWASASDWMHFSDTGG